MILEIERDPGTFFSCDPRASRESAPPTGASSTAPAADDIRTKTTENADDNEREGSPSERLAGGPLTEGPHGRIDHPKTRTCADSSTEPPATRLSSEGDTGNVASTSGGAPVGVAIATPAPSRGSRVRGADDAPDSVDELADTVPTPTNCVTLGSARRVSSVAGAATLGDTELEDHAIRLRRPHGVVPANANASTHGGGAIPAPTFASTHHASLSAGAADPSRAPHEHRAREPQRQPGVMAESANASINGFRAIPGNITLLGTHQLIQDDQPVCDPTQYDVRFGRGSKCVLLSCFRVLCRLERTDIADAFLCTLFFKASTYMHPGNQAFRARVRNHIPEAHASTALGRNAMAVRLVKEFRRSGVRFLRYRNADGVWRDAGDRAAIQKVLQVWRDAASGWICDSAPPPPPLALEVRRRSHLGSIPLVSLSSTYLST